MDPKAVIILDPVNMNVIKDALARAAELDRRQLHRLADADGPGGLFQRDLVGVGDLHDLPGRLRCRCPEHARAAVPDGRTQPLGQGTGDDPASAILDIDREVAGTMRDEAFPSSNFGVPLAGA